MCLPAGKASAPGEFESSLEDVRRHIGTERMHYHSGLFSATADTLSDGLFSRSCIWTQVSTGPRWRRG